MKKNLPVFEIKIDENENMIVDAVAIVSDPAIERNFLTFNREKKTNLNFADDEKMQLLGCAMIPNFPIYRKDEIDGEYYVVFSKEEIEKIVKVFMKNGLTKSLNVEHNSDVSANSFIFQSFITSQHIKAPENLGDVPIGSWIIGVQVEDKNLWKEIKEGKRNGFSIEGLFNLFDTKKTISENEEDEDFEIIVGDWMKDNDDDKELETTFKTLMNYFKYLEKKF